jgi:hypothetical protein
MLRASVKRGVRWVFQVEYIQPGQAPAYTALGTAEAG